MSGCSEIGWHELAEYRRPARFSVYTAAHVVCAAFAEPNLRVVNVLEFEDDDPEWFTVRVV